MGYKLSRKGRKFIEKINRVDKASALVPFTKRSILEILVDSICILLLIISIPVGVYTKRYDYTLGILVLTGIIFSLRELFIQNDKTIVRIYGPLGRLRYLFEDTFRDKYLQYFNETNTDGRPIPRIVRDYVYQKAKNLKAIASFGTELDSFDLENTTLAHILHRNFPGHCDQPSYEVVIGERRPDVRPFKVTNTVNISGMSYGSINWKAAECLSIGAKEVAYVNCGEGGYGPHGVAGNDVVFQIGTGKYGVGKEGTLNDGTPTRFLDEDLLVDLVRTNDNIHMIQLKITQGAKPAMGGVLPARKVTPEIAEVRKVEPWKMVLSPSQHAEVIASTPKDSIIKLLDFIVRIRKLTELPVGIKLCVGRLEEIDLLVEIMKQYGDWPDAIQIDGSDGGTGAGDNIFLNYVGFGNCIETTSYLHTKLKEARIRDNIVISSSGRLLTPAHAAMAFAYGTDIIDTARGVMLALGCIQSLHCHTNECPTGITTNSKWRMHGLTIGDKSTRVHNYLSGFHEDMLHITKILNHSDPRDITPKDIRMLSYKYQFSDYMDPDPFGTHIKMRTDQYK